MPTRARVGVALLIAVACLSSVGRLVEAIRNTDPQYRWTARVADYSAERYAGLEDVLPPRVVVGFVDGGACDNPVQAYYLTQYALAPRVVVQDDGPPWVLVDGRPDRPLRELPGSVVLVRDLGNGVRLFRRGGP
jgi:hypothetical protein